MVSAEVWEHLADQGWGSGLVGDNGKPSPSGFRLLYWTPERGGVTGLAEVDGEVETDGLRTAVPTAPFHGGSRGLASLPAHQQQYHTVGRSSCMAGVAVAGGAVDGSASGVKHGRSASLEASSGPVRSYGPGTRWVGLIIRIRYVWRCVRGYVSSNRRVCLPPSLSVPLSRDAFWARFGAIAHQYDVQ